MLRKLWQMVAVMLACLLVVICIGSVKAADDTLFPLPWKAYGSDGNLRQWAVLNSVSNQSVYAYPGEIVNLKTFISIFNPANPLEKQQSFLIYSWTPYWPPPAGYYYTLYDGIPGLSPGISQAVDVPIVAPIVPGTYYVWFCSSAGYNAQTAINAFSNVLPPLAHVAITVTPRNAVSFLVSNSPGAKSTYSFIAGQAIREGLVAIGTVFYTPRLQDFQVPIAEVTSLKSRIIWIICADEERADIEKALRRSGFAGDVRYFEGKYFDFTLSDNISEISKPFSKGDVLTYRLLLTNTGWMPLDTVTADFTVSRPGLTPIGIDSRSLTMVPTGVSAVIEFKWPVPQTAENNEYILSTKVTGYEGPGKSGFVHEELKSSMIKIGSFSLPVVPIALAAIAMILIAAILVSSRRKASGSQNRKGAQISSGQK
jgi:hypothetical protein